MTKIDIISGFLGAGKTTLIRKLIEEAYRGEKLVLIENEFGEIGIDGGFLQDAGITITEMNSGCICCSLVGDFGAALQRVLAEFQPDRILIEPSGVGKLSDVIAAVRGLNAADAILNSAVTVADATKCRLYMKNFGEFYNNQIGHAAAIILSRTDRMSEETLLSCVALLRENNAEAPIITTPWTQLRGEQILAAMEQRSGLKDELSALIAEERASCPVCGHPHGHDHQQDGHGGHGHEHHHHDEHCDCGHEHHHADEVFASWGAETPRAYSREELSEILSALEDEDAYGTVLRAKGTLPCSDGSWLHFDYVPGEGALRAAPVCVSGRICVIGVELREEALAALFRLS